MKHSSAEDFLIYGPALMHREPGRFSGSWARCEPSVSKDAEPTRVIRKSVGIGRVEVDTQDQNHCKALFFFSLYVVQAFIYELGNWLFERKAHGYQGELC